MNWPNLKNFSNSELEEMSNAIKREMDTRKDERFKELTSVAANALNLLKQEFPWVSLTVTGGCYSCGEDVDINLFDYFTHFEASDFSR